MPVDDAATIPVRDGRQLPRDVYRHRGYAGGPPGRQISRTSEHIPDGSGDRAVVRAVVIAYHVDVSRLEVVRVIDNGARRCVPMRFVPATIAGFSHANRHTADDNTDQHALYKAPHVAPPGTWGTCAPKEQRVCQRIQLGKAFELKALEPSSELQMPQVSPSQDGRWTSVVNLAYDVRDATSTTAAMIPMWTFPQTRRIPFVFSMR